MQCGGKQVFLIERNSLCPFLSRFFKLNIINLWGILAVVRLIGYSSFVSDSEIPLVKYEEWEK